MRAKLSICTRNILSPLINESDYDETFVVYKTVYGRLENLSGAYIFDGTNTQRTATHRFVIRYLAGLNETYWIKYGEENYDIINVTNLQGRKRFTQIDCLIRGDEDLAVNKA
jgi:SPP1 family predicted phage head-tail adaptor